MNVIGIAGGIASGKSSVADELKKLGVETLDADRVAHEVLREVDVKEKLNERWGQEIFDNDGEIDRNAVAKIVFGPPPEGPQELAYLEQIVHPRIGQRLREQLDERRKSDAKAVVLDAAVMFKAGWDKFCDKIVFVDSPRALRLDRARQRGWSDASFAAREEAQESLEEKLKHAHVVIDNSGSLEETQKQLREFWYSLDM